MNLFEPLYPIFNWLAAHKVVAVLTSLGAIAAIVSLLLKLFHPARKEALEKDASAAITQTLTGTGTNITVQGDFIQGYSEKNYLEFLTKRNEELAAELALTREDEKSKRQMLEIELNAVQEKLLNIDSSYAQQAAQLADASFALNKLKSELPGEQVKKGQDSLKKGDIREAETLFDSIIEKDSPSMALAAYESGRLAESRIDYAKWRNSIDSLANMQRPSLCISGQSQSWKKPSQTNTRILML